MCAHLKCKDRGQVEGGTEQIGQEVMSEQEKGSHTVKRETQPPLAEMKGYFNWVSDACLILFSILIPYNVHNQNKYTLGGRGALIRKL